MPPSERAPSRHRYRSNPASTGTQPRKPFSCSSPAIHHIDRGVSVVLFIRQAKNDSSGRTMPYFNADTATYVDRRNERPMQVTWRLDQPLPGDTFASYRAAIA